MLATIEVVAKAEVVAEAEVVTSFLEPWEEVILLIRELVTPVEGVIWVATMVSFAQLLHMVGHSWLMLCTLL